MDFIPPWLLDDVLRSRHPNIPIFLWNCNMNAEKTGLSLSEITLHVSLICRNALARFPGLAEMLSGSSTYFLREQVSSQNANLLFSPSESYIRQGKIEFFDYKPNIEVDSNDYMKKQE